MADLIHGGDIYSAKEKGIENILDFSANINPRGLPLRVKQAIIERLDDCVNYPDPLCRELTARISDYEKISEKCILCGNGAADIIFRMVLALKPQKALIPAPTFAEYETALNTVGCKTVHYFLEEKEGFIFSERYIEMLDISYDMIFLCNPNNPTGQLMPKALLEKILAVCMEKDIIMVLDECFMEFVEDFENITMKPYVEKCENLFILKAFTKSYAMPGLRLGYGLSGGGKLLQKINSMGQPWTVSVPAQIAGIQALKEQDYLEESMKEIRQEKEYLDSELNRLGIKHYRPAANYIFLNVLENSCYDVNTFKEKLLGKGIMIRDCSNYIGLEKGYFRIAVKSHEANIRLIEVMETIGQEK